MVQRFRDRTEAGQLLAAQLGGYAGRADVLVLALPRGGVPVAYEVARALGAPLDVYVVRKLGVPGQEELAMGAIATGGVRVLNEEVVAALHIPEATSVVVAVPTAAAATCEELRAEVDEVVSVLTPEPFYAVGLWYDDFAPPSDEEIRALLDRAAHEHAAASPES